MDNNHLCYIQYRMMEIFMVKFDHVSLECLWYYCSIISCYNFNIITASTKINCLVFMHLSLSSSPRTFCWYRCIIFQFIGKLTSGSPSVLYSLNIFFVVYVGSCVVFLFPLLINHDRASGNMLFFQGYTQYLDFIPA